MILFPLIRGIEVRGYQLYPGRDNAGLLEQEMGTGPWIVLGVNGLGKSTLLLLMRYLLAGPVRTRAAGFAGEREDLQNVSNRLFAVRVADGAQNASGQIEVHFGKAVLRVERSLANLALTQATITASEGVTQTVKVEDDYRAAVATLMGVTQFEDVIRVLDHLVFYLEARQPLIWDGAAQFELFRALLTPSLSADLRRLEGEIVSADSTARNLSATLYKITQRREKDAVKRANANDTRARIAAAQGELDSLRKAEMRLSDELDAAELERSDCNLRRKRSEQAVDDAAQAYEKLKFEVLRQAFAGLKPTDQYVFLKLLSDRICVACNQAAPAAADEIQSRHDESRCVICGNPRTYSDNIGSIGDALKSKSEEAFTQLEARRSELEEHKSQFTKASTKVQELQVELGRFRSKSEETQNLIRRLKKNLPPDESLALSKEEDRISVLRNEVLSFRRERDDAERLIDELLEQLRGATERVREQLERSFYATAKPFFAENVRLVYAPRTTRIGQAGRPFEFPAFEIEMTSGATLGQFVRRSPDQVSLSQREYLDLIFRMVLVNVLGGGVGSLVIDGPEGSLDAVFASRAGDLFSLFSQKDGANIILACNIVEGDFIPYTLAGYRGDDRTKRVVDLISQAAPTQALASLRPEYTQKVAEILAREPRT